MSTPPNQTTPPKYSISIGNGYVTVEAPTKDECVELLREASKIKTNSPITEAIR